MEAVACSKLSTVYNNYGDTVESAQLAREGLALAPTDAYATRIRLRGNLAVTATFFESFETTIQECKRVAVESAERGYEQFAAIAHHNLGALLRDAGHLEEGLANLYRAARYWEASPTNPFADSSELVLTLLALGRDDEALSVAESAVVRTRPWPKAFAEARLGLAAVYGYQGRFGEAVEVLRDLADRGDVLGSAREKALALFAECVYLGGGSVDELVAIEQRLGRDALDPRLALTTAVGKALIAHRRGKCKTACREAFDALGRWRQMGARHAADRAELPLAVLRIDHDVDRGLAAVAAATEQFPTLDGTAKWWLRRISNHTSQALIVLGGPALLIRLIKSDPEYWMPHGVAAVPLLSGAQRQELLEAIQDSAEPEAIPLLRNLDGADVQEVRRVLIQRGAPRVFIRSFGALAIHRGSWSSPPSIIGRRRIRLLLGLLVANYDGGLTRDQAIDVLWPDADPASAINSLNQSVFQLRRLIEPSYREGESAQYIISNVDAVQLNRELVVTDLAVLRQLRAELRSPASLAHRTEMIHQLVDLIRGEYLADLKYEDWVSQAQMSVHSEVRATLLPVALGEVLAGGDEWAFKAGCALVSLDAYDEEAHIAMVRHLSASGRRSQARTLAHGFAERLRTELDEEPSQELILAARIAGETLPVQ
jgi:DNA-binding SARP family transcriptional activator